MTFKAWSLFIRPSFLSGWPASTPLPSHLLSRASLCGSSSGLFSLPTLISVSPLWPWQVTWNTNFFLSSFLFLSFPFLFLGPHPWQMEDPRLGVESELQLPAYTTATATRGLSHICGLHHSSQQCQVLNPLREARDGTCILMDTSQIRYCWAMVGTPLKCQFFTLRSCKLGMIRSFWVSEGSIRWHTWR